MTLSVIEGEGPQPSPVLDTVQREQVGRLALFLPAGDGHNANPGYSFQWVARVSAKLAHNFDETLERIAPF